MDVEDIKAATARRGFSLRELGRRAHYNASYISRVFNGVQGPSDDLLRALADALDLNEDDERVAHAMARPARVDAAAVRALAEALAAQRRADDVVGPAPLIGAAEAHREALLTMLRDAQGPHRDKLCEVVSENSQFAGWLHIELNNYDRANALLSEAIDLADDIDHGALAAQAHNLKGNIARQKGNWRAVHRNFVAAHASSEALRQRVVNGAQAASALAELGRRSEAERFLRDIEKLRERAVEEEPPGTAYWLTPEWLSMPIGHVHLALGRPKQGAEHIRYGLDSLPEEHKDALWTREAKEALQRVEDGK